MTDTLYSFVDESGDPVLFGKKRGSGPIIGNQGCSHYFIMGKLEVDDPVDLSKKLNALREDLLADPYFAGVESFKPEREKTAHCFHAAKDLPEVRYQVFRLLREQGKALRFHAVVADKQVIAAREMARRKTDPKARYGSAADNQSWNIIFVANALVDMNLFYRGGNVSYPLRFAPVSDSLAFDRKPRPNFKGQFLKTLSSRLGLPRTTDFGLPSGLTPEDIFHYTYAVFHSPRYRSRYAEFLKIDFPRLPLTASLELFRELARLGGELVALHLLESSKLEEPITEFIGNSREVTKVTYTNGTVWINGGGTKKDPKPGTSGFTPVPENVWNFHIGGYQVCEKWLKDRKGRTLTEEDIAHYHKIVIALTETIRLMAEIDEVIETHGGWPGAFQTESSEQD